MSYQDKNLKSLKYKIYSVPNYKKYVLEVNNTVAAVVVLVEVVKIIDLDVPNKGSVILYLLTNQDITLIVKQK